MGGAAHEAGLRYVRRLEFNIMELAIREVRMNNEPEYSVPDSPLKPSASIFTSTGPNNLTDIPRRPFCDHVRTTTKLPQCQRH